MILDKLTRPFITGLITLVPIILTGQIIYWFFSFLEQFLKIPILWLVPREYYVPGLGVLLSLIVLYLVGLFMQAWIVKTIFSWFEKTFIKLPLVEDIYKSIKGFLLYLSPKSKSKLSTVVKVAIPGSDIIVLGFQTKQEGEVPKEVELDAEEYLQIYFPMGLNVGGYSAFVPKKYVTPLDWSAKKAMSYMLSAGVISEKAIK